MSRRRPLVALAAAVAATGFAITGGPSAGAADGGGLVPVPPALQPVVDAMAPAVAPACGTAGTAAFLVAIFGSQAPEDANVTGAAFPVVGVVFIACGTFPRPADPSRCAIDETLVVAVKQIPNGALVPVAPPGGTVVDSARALGKLATAGDDLAGVLAGDSVIVQTLDCRSTAIVPVPEAATDPPSTPEPPGTSGAGPPPAGQSEPPAVSSDPLHRPGAEATVPNAEPLPPPPTGAVGEVALTSDPGVDANLIGRRVNEDRTSWWLLAAVLAAGTWRFSPRLLRRIRPA